MIDEGAGHDWRNGGGLNDTPQFRDELSLRGERCGVEYVIADHIYPVGEAVDPYTRESQIFEESALNLSPPQTPTYNPKNLISILTPQLLH